MAAIMDDTPIALRKKRRSSTMGNVLSVPSKVQEEEDTSMSNNKAPATPVRPKKRVRFSDPGPVLIDDLSSTGITPFVQRTSLCGMSRSPSPPGSRHARSTKKRTPSRHSMPGMSDPSRFDLASSSIQVQFGSMRQILDDRVKRRLRRRLLSEEMNIIDADKKLALKQDQRISDLEHEIALLNSVPGGTTESQTRVDELQSEIDDLKERLRAASTPAPMTPDDDDSEGSMQFDVPSSPCSTVAFTDDYGSVPSTPFKAGRESEATATNSIAVQVELDTQLEMQREHLMNARMELEHLVPGETPLPLSPSPDGDVSPMLSALLSHLRSAMAEVSRIKKLLKASEAQESKLRSEFNKSLKQFESARSYNKTLENNLGKFNSAFHKEKARHEAQLDTAVQEVRRLEQEKSESEHSISSLTKALDKYRADVKDLEDLITRMESKHSTVLSKLEKKHEQELDDLGAHIDAETRGRRIAEMEVEEMDLKVAELDTLNRELKQALHQKQQTLRTLEAEWDQQREQLEREVGGLNVRLGEAQGQIGDLEEQVALERKRTYEAVGKVVESASRAGEEAVREIVPAHDGQVSFGLLTPHVDGGRFIDVVSAHVQGHVENRRGKASKKRKYPDSGIGILEEDQSELLSSDL